MVQNKMGKMTGRLTALLLALIMISGMIAFSWAEGDGNTDSSTLSDLNVKKNINWTPGSNEAEVVITSDIPDKNETEVLFLGTLCGAHQMAKTTVASSLNAIAQNANVQYYLFNAGETDVPENTSNYGYLLRGSALPTDEKDITYTYKDKQNHASLAAFINTLYSELVINNKGYYGTGTELKEPQIDYIVLEFDSSRLADGFSDSSMNATMNAVAKELAEYYKNNKVIWVTDATYTPTNFYTTQGSSISNWLTGYAFRSLCALVAPSYYMANTNASDSSKYGNGQNGTGTPHTQITLDSSYSLTTVNSSGTTSYEKYNNARQLTYDNATTLAEFLYMVIPGISLEFNDQIEFSDDLSVTAVDVAVTTETSLPEAASATAWTSRGSLTVAGAAINGEEGSKHVSSTSADNNTTINVTTGNTDTKKNNLVTISAKNLKGADSDHKLTWIKVVIKLTSTNQFADCITMKTKADGTPEYDEKGNFQYTMNPNNGPVEAKAYSGSTTSTGTAIAEGDSVAAVVAVNGRKIKSEVTGGTKTQTGGDVKTEDAEKNPYIYSADYKTVTTGYAPYAGYVFKSVTIDNTVYTADSFGTDTVLSGTGYTVTLDKATGALTVIFASLTADHDVAAVYESALSITKTVSQSKAMAGETISYTLEVTNSAPTDATGITVSDTLETNLSPDASGCTTGASVTGQTVSWSDQTVQAGKKNSYTVSAKINPDLTAETTEIRNTAVVKNKEGEELAKSSEVTMTAIPRTVTVNYAYKEGSTVPSGAILPTPDNEDYGAAYSTKTQEAVAGWIFNGWHTDTSCASDYKDGTALTKENLPSLATGDALTLYGDWTYGLSMTKIVDKEKASGGDTLTYTITVSNSSNGAVTDYTVKDVISDVLEYQSYTTTSTTGNYVYTKANRTFTATGLTVPANGSISLTISAKADPELTEVKSVSNTATGLSKEKDGKKDPDISPADLPVTEVSPRMVHVTYQYVGYSPLNAAVPENSADLAYGSTGYQAAASSKTALTNPDWFTFGGWYTDSGLTGAYDSTTALTKENYTSLENEGDEIILYGAWTPKEGFTVAKTAAYNDKTVDNGTVSAGSTVLYRITVTNLNPESTSVIDIEDAVPTGLTVNESSISDSGRLSGGKICWTGLSLAGGKSLTVSFNATVPAALEQQTTYENLAYVTKTGGKDYTGEGSKENQPGKETFYGIPYVFTVNDFTFDKTAVEVSKAGGEFTYTITLKNNRIYETAKNIEIVDIIPAGLSVTEAKDENTDNTLVNSNNRYVWTIARLIPQETAKLTITVAVPGTATAEEYRNIAQITEIGGSEVAVPKDSPEAKTAVRNFTVTKEWYEGTEKVNGEGRPEVTVMLKQNGSTYGTSVKLNKENNWTYTWDQLPLRDSEGTPYVYTVDETEQEAYTYEISYGCDEKAGISGNSRAVLKNTIKTIEISYQFAGDVPEGEEIPDPETVNYGTELIPAELPEKEYYLTEGWYTDPECTKIFETGTPLNKTNTTDGELSLYTKWTKKTVKLIYEEDAAVPDVTYPEGKTIEQGKKADPEDPEDPKENYIFEGWYLDEACTIPFTNPVLNDDNTEDGELHLYPKWTKKVKVTYHFTNKNIPEGAILPENLTLEPGAVVYNEDDLGQVKQYKFSGWYLDPACKVPYVEGSVIYEDLDLYGKWETIAVTGEKDFLVNWIVMFFISMAGFLTILEAKKRRVKW